MLPSGALTTTCWTTWGASPVPVLDAVIPDPLRESKINTSMHKKVYCLPHISPRLIAKRKYGFLKSKITFQANNKTSTVKKGLNRFF
jgi:hypothetical protein